MEKETLPCAVLILFTIACPGSTQVALLSTVTGPDVLVTNGTNELHLTCEVATPSSVDRYEWFTPDPDSHRCGTTSKECTFTPTLLDNEKDVTCNSLGSTGNTLSSASYTVNLKYSARRQIGGSLHCPDRWIEGKLVTLEFRLNISLFQQVCTDTDNSPFFVNTQSLVGKCVADNATNTCGSFDPGTLGCGCAGRGQGNYVVQYNFIALPDFNGNWSAGIICKDTSRVQQLYFPAINCDDKQVALPDFRTLCPSQGFTEGAFSTIQCTMNTDPFNRLCNSVGFYFVSTPGVRVQWCWSDYANCSSSGLARPPCNGCSCQCVKRSGNTFTYNLTFTAELSHNNGSFLCDTTCAAAPGRPQPSFDHSACDRIAVGLVVEDDSIQPGRTPDDDSPRPGVRPDDDSSTPGNKPDDDSSTPGNKPDDNIKKPGATTTGASNALIIGVSVPAAICAVMAAFGFGLFWKRRSEGQHNAPLANAPPANAPSSHALQVFGDKTVHESLDSELDDSSGSELETSVAVRQV
ncbi:uncharacterized protein [Littorina saxatilis]|uniref:Ig-like domain-containing protein n=1 Tax=Littorina saxatilis TaxID=31220 RepID=A0AAN9AVZ3_9CAEN